MSALRSLAVLPIRFYQRFVSPLMPATCRFSPTCSSYAKNSIEVHGVLRGTWLSLVRIMRCHPFGGSGYDPVPPPRGGSTDPPTNQE